MNLLEPLERRRAETIELLDALSDDQVRAVHAGSGWTAGQILAHIARSELGEAFVIRQAKAGEVIDMGLDARDAFNAEGAEQATEWDRQRLRSELADSWEALEAACADLQEADLKLPVRWPEWPAQTIGESVPYMVAHEDEHAGWVREAIGTEG